MEKRFKCRIEDVHDIHDGFDLELQPGYTALVGPNGAGKTTLLGQIEEIAKERGYAVVKYANYVDGGSAAMQMALESGQMRKLASLACGSEGQQILINMTGVLDRIEKAIDEAIASRTGLVVLLDSLDSGLSIDGQRTLICAFAYFCRTKIRFDYTGNEIYIVAAVNDYELAVKDCVDVQTGEHMTFKDYPDYADFICGYDDAAAARRRKNKAKTARKVKKGAERR